MTKKSCQVIIGGPFYKLKRELRFGLNLKYRLYRLRWNWAPKLRYVTRYPTHIDFETTNKCNLRCVMCAREFMEANKGEIDFDLFKKVIDEAAGNGLKSIKLNWRGEPLIHPKVPEMVEYAKNKGVIEVMFNSNGILLTKELSRKLINTCMILSLSIA